MKKYSVYYACFYCLLLSNSYQVFSHTLGLPLNNVAQPQASLRYDVSGSSAWYPYFINDKNNPGIISEVIEEILKAANIKGVKLSFPPLRTILALKHGEIDFDLINLNWLTSKDREGNFVYSEHIIRIKEYIVTLKDAPLNDSLLNEAISPRENIGTVRGYYYHDDDKFTRIDFSSEHELIKALKLNRLSKIIIGDRPALYWSSLLDVPIKFTKLHSDGFLRIRLRSEFSYLIPQLNKAIKDIKTNGKLDVITHRYVDPTDLNAIEVQ